MRRKVLKGWAIEDADGETIGIPDITGLDRPYPKRSAALAEVNWPGCEPDRALIHYRVVLEQIKRVPLKTKKGKAKA
jgi:hypothetical protein